MLRLSRVVPPLYTSFRVRSRAFRWYARLREGEAKLETGTDARETLLDELDRVTHRIAVPQSYAEEPYALRNNIHAVRKRLLAQRSRRRRGRLTGRGAARGTRLVLPSFSPVLHMHAAFRAERASAAQRAMRNALSERTAVQQRKQTRSGSRAQGASGFVAHRLHGFVAPG